MKKSLFAIILVGLIATISTISFGMERSENCEFSKKRSREKSQLDESSERSEKRARVEQQEDKQEKKELDINQPVQNLETRFNLLPEEINRQIAHFTASEFLNKHFYEKVKEIQHLSDPSLNNVAHTGSIYFVSFNPCDTEIFTASNDHTVKVWDAHTRELLKTFDLGNNNALNIEYSPCLTKLVIVLDNGSFQVWNAKTGDSLYTIQHDDLIEMKFSPSGKLIGTIAENKTVRILDAETGLEKHTINWLNDDLYSIALSPCDTKVALGIHESVLIIDLETKRVLCEYYHDCPVSLIKFSTCGSFITTVTTNGSVRRWDINDEKVLHHFEPKITCICDDECFCDASVDPTGLAFNVNSLVLGICLVNDNAYIWDVDTKELLRIFPYNNANTIALSSCGTMITTASTDGTATIYYFDNPLINSLSETISPMQATLIYLAYHAKKKDSHLKIIPGTGMRAVFESFPENIQEFLKEELDIEIETYDPYSTVGMIAEWLDDNEYWDNVDKK